MLNNFYKSYCFSEIITHEILNGSSQHLVVSARTLAINFITDGS
jgi:hypothetical protein